MKPSITALLRHASHPILKGRDFDPSDRGGAPLVAIVSEEMHPTALRRGQPSAPTPLVAVGVVGDVRYLSWRRPRHPYPNGGQDPSPYLGFRVFCGQLFGVFCGPAPVHATIR